MATAKVLHPFSEPELCTEELTLRGRAGVGRGRMGAASATYNYLTDDSRPTRRSDLG